MGKTIKSHAGIIIAIITMFAAIVSATTDILSLIK